MSSYKNASNEIKSLFSKLTDKLESCSLEKSVHQECLAFVKAARRAAKNDEVEAAVDQIDLFVLCLKRNLCTQIALQHAADLFEIAVAEVKPRFGEPGQIFAEAQPFAERLITLAMASGGPLVPRPRPVPRLMASGRRAMPSAGRFGRMACRRPPRLPWSNRSAR